MNRPATTERADEDFLFRFPFLFLFLFLCLGVTINLTFTLAFHLFPFLCSSSLVASCSAVCQFRVPVHMDGWRWIGKAAAAAAVALLLLSTAPPGGPRREPDVNNNGRTFVFNYTLAKAVVEYAAAAARPGDVWFVRSALRSVLRVHNALLGPRFGVLHPLVVAAPISIAHFASLPRVGSISLSRCSSLATATPLPPGAGPGVLSAAAAASSGGRRRPPPVVSGGGGSTVFSDFGVWNSKHGAAVEDVLAVIHSLKQGLQTEDANISLRLQSFESFHVSELSPLKVTTMLHKIGPMVGALYAGDEFFSNTVYRGITRHGKVLFDLFCTRHLRSFTSSQSTNAR